VTKARQAVLSMGAHATGASGAPPPPLLPLPLPPAGCWRLHGLCPCCRHREVVLTTGDKLDENTVFVHGSDDDGWVQVQVRLWGQAPQQTCVLVGQCHPQANAADRARVNSSMLPGQPQTCS